MFDGGLYSGIGHALHKRRAMSRVAGRVQSEIAIERTNGGVGGPIHHYRAQHGCKIDVNAGGCQL